MIAKYINNKIKFNNIGIEAYKSIYGGVCYGFDR